MEKCSIIIAAYNEATSLRSCLESLESIDSSSEDYEIIVVDNNSTDNTQEIVKNFPKVTYLFEKNIGASSARNKGIRFAQNDILIFLDADTVVFPQWLSELLKPFNRKDIGAVGGAILPFKDKNIISQYMGISLFLKYPRYGSQREIKGYPSCNLAIRKNLLPNGFDTSTFTTYGEDKDICYSIMRKGYKVVFQPSAIIRHRHPESFAEFFNLIFKSSSGRVSFGKKYPTAPDILFFNLHIPFLYPLILFLFTFFYGINGFLVVFLPGLLYLAISSIISFLRCHSVFLSFFVKPILDIFAVYAIYFSYLHHKRQKNKRSTLWI